MTQVEAPSVTPTLSILLTFCEKSEHKFYPPPLPLSLLPPRPSSLSPRRAITRGRKVARSRTPQRGVAVPRGARLSVAKTDARSFDPACFDVASYGPSHSESAAADGSAARAPSDPIIRQLFRRERALRRSGSAHPRCIRDFAARLRRASGAFLARARNVCWNVSLGAAGTFLERFSDVAGRFWTARLLSAYAMPSRFQGAVQGRAGCVSGPRAERFWNVSANVFGTFLERF